MIPALNVAIQGQGVTSADNLNTFIQGGGVFLANLRAFSGISGLNAYMSGYSSPNDGGQGNFYWNTTTGTDDGGLTTIVPTGSTAGCWSRIGGPSNTRIPQTVSASTGQTLAAVNVTNEILVRSGAAGVTDTFPSASAIIAAMTGQQPGAVRPLLVINENSGTLLLAPGSGVTFIGNLATGNFSMSTVTQRLFYLYYASSGNVTVYG